MVNRRLLLLQALHLCTSLLALQRLKIIKRSRMKSKRKHRFWVRELSQKRSQSGAFTEYMHHGQINLDTMLDDDSYDRFLLLAKTGSKHNNIIGIKIKFAESCYFLSVTKYKQTDLSNNTQRVQHLVQVANSCINIVYCVNSSGYSALNITCWIWNLTMAKVGAGSLRRDGSNERQNNAASSKSGSAWLFWSKLPICCIVVTIAFVYKVVVYILFQGLI